MAECIRVLHMIGSLNMGGSQAMVMNLYRAIDRNKVQFDFVIDYPNELYFADEIKSMGGRIYVLPVFKGNNYLEIRKAWELFLKEHKEYRILHSHVRSYASLYLPIAKKYGLKTIIHSHSTSSGNGFKSIVKRMLQVPLRYQADYLFACSKESGEWLYGNNVVRKKNYFVISNAIDSSRFDFNEGKREKVRADLGVSDKHVIGHVGRMTDVKNHLFLIDIFSEICTIDKNAHLLLVGDGELRVQIEKKIFDKQLTDKVSIIGNVLNTEDYYQAMDVFVFPSKWEGLGIAVVEAQTSGLPCVVSDSVPKEVDIGAGLVTFFELSTGPKNWACGIKELYAVTRFKQAANTKATGYDIKKNALWMQDFYLNLIDADERENNN